VAIRRIAQRKKLKLSEYGLFRGKRRLAARTEEEIYEALGLEYVPPEMREDRGELALAAEHRLPPLIEAEDIRGDMQVHTSWTDGSQSIEKMAREASASTCPTRSPGRRPRPASASPWTPTRTRRRSSVSFRSSGSVSRDGRGWSRIRWSTR